jgi:hypothetical protein
MNNKNKLILDAYTFRKIIQTNRLNDVIGTSAKIFDVVKKRKSRTSPEKHTSNINVKKSSH